MRLKAWGQMDPLLAAEVKRADGRRRAPEVALVRQNDGRIEVRGRIGDVVQVSEAVAAVKRALAAKDVRVLARYGRVTGSMTPAATRADDAFGLAIEALRGRGYRMVEVRNFRRFLG